MKKEFFAKALNNLSVARVCFDNGFYDACTNRAYYAALQGTVAVLAFYGITRERVEHKWVHAEFSSNLIRRRKIFPSKLKSYLMEMQVYRDQADYETEVVGRKIASEQLGKAEEMLTFIGKELK